MKMTAFLLSVVSLLSLGLFPSIGRAQETWRLGSTYGGKVYQSPSDPGYLAYEKEAKAILVEKIRKRYGVELKADLLSSDQLLEVEALLRFKRSHESPEEVLSRFPGIIVHSPSS